MQCGFRKLNDKERDYEGKSLEAVGQESCGLVYLPHRHPPSPISLKEAHQPLFFFVIWELYRCPVHGVNREMKQIQIGENRSGPPPDRQITARQEFSGLRSEIGKDLVFASSRE